MKARPILFSSAMVRSLLAGTKSQTRRALKPQPYSNCVGVVSYGDEFLQRLTDGTGEVFILGNVNQRLRCPYGQPRELLAVKESAWMWCERRPNGKTKTGRLKWRYDPLDCAPRFYRAALSAKFLIRWRDRSG